MPAIKLKEFIESQKGTVILKQPVKKIVHNNEGAIVETEVARYHAKRVIVCIPPFLLSRIDFSPSLPSKYQTLIDRMPMGSVIKVVLQYSSRWWNDLGLSGQMVSDTGPCTMFIEHSLPDNSFIGLVAFICSRDARVFGSKPLSERRQDVVAQLAHLTTRAEEAARIVRYHEYNWNEDPFSRGCYVGVMGPGVLTHHAPLVDLLRQGHGCISFASTETSHLWCGYMEGAVRSGKLAASQVDNVLHSLDASGNSQPPMPLKK